MPKWKTIKSTADFEKVLPGKRVRNRKTGEEFVVVKVNGVADGKLQIEAQPVLAPPVTFAYRNGKWGFA